MVKDNVDYSVINSMPETLFSEAPLFLQIASNSVNIESYCFIRNNKKSKGSA